MRLLILTQTVDMNDPNLGFFHRWIEEFASHVPSVEVLCLREGKHELPANVRVRSLGKERGGGRISYVVRFYRTLAALSGAYDAVFIHMNSEYLLLAGLYWRVKGIPTVLWHTHKSMTLVHRIGEKLVDLVATASPESYRLRSKKVRVLGHGIDTNEFAPTERTGDGTFRIVTAGRISRVKDLGTLIVATESLVATGTRVETLILGSPLTDDDEKHLGELQGDVGRRSLGGVVHFVGSVPHRGVLAYLASADAFVNCSSTGSLDKAVLEAMAAGVPVLTSNDGLTSALGQYAKDLMFPKGDSASLASRLAWLSHLAKDEREGLVTGLRRIVVERHSLRALVPKLLLLLQSKDV